MIASPGLFQQPRPVRGLVGYPRAAFGNGRFRLFFRYDSRAMVIIFAWVNDETTLRTYGSKSDAYAVFKGMLDKGNPPDDWAALLQSTCADEAQQSSLGKL
ncbi:hypothetical protein FHS94_003765 [Sphingomonas aerophila]|uniref:Toxin YhaV n=1 Tax=Sphingomonas aerophila TaxID=1344948 RepID=A0A7W9BH26_9SPHN|nr:hypothetical protein [Sphingomonas aerophila]